MTFPFSGYTRRESHVAGYLPERCMFQFGYVDGIKRQIPVMPYEDIDRWFRSNIVRIAHAIRDNIVGFFSPRQCLDGYLE